MGRAVVGGEEDQRVRPQPELLQQVEDPADAPVQPGHHRGVAGPGRGVRLIAPLAPIGGIVPAAPVLGERVLRDLDGHVRDGERQVEEEGLILVRGEEREGLGLEEVVRVLPARRAAGVALELDLAAVALEVAGIVVVGVPLAVVAEEVVEALAPGVALRADRAQAPLADAGGGVALFLEHLGEGDLAVRERDLAGKLLLRQTRRRIGCRGPRHGLRACPSSGSTATGRRRASPRRTA